MFKYSILAIFSLFIFFGFSPNKTAYAQPQSTPIVLELFTSKYCPACPAGDRNFNAALQNNPNVIGLSCHVTYFNRSKRSDYLSSAFCDARQGMYKNALNTGGIFTPMMIVNGKAYTTGIKSRELSRNFQITPAIPSAIDLIKNGQYLDIRLPQMSLAQNADIWLFEIEKHQKRNGYTQYKNTVRNITKLLKWNGRAMNMAFPISADPNKAYAVIAQTQNGKIISAGIAN